VREPYAYYRDNVAKSLELFNGLGMPRVVFNSSASLYATGPGFEVHQNSPSILGHRTPRTKQVMEMALADMSAATDLRAIVLRFLNPIGSDPDFRSGGYDRAPSHVLGQLVAAALGEIEASAITGVDHPNRDGSGIRDYIHV
jgi:UDP-glucose 4-epimerase